MNVSIAILFTGSRGVWSSLSAASPIPALYVPPVGRGAGVGVGLLVDPHDPGRGHLQAALYAGHMQRG